ncbi:hypothetical protein D0C16_16785 [Cellvibrio sp. KY-GH-1]|uniref:hypothetical protein n=1 Tax=Cellvibrio sp. KY-GH-1 TaxID=2303332 RepID=UPI001248C9F8|nr:hypothetical protein [Cellvibrio sp. KY-GH-1]QEY17492.1 hypothetical protein D0C16_16785 [Cellvibrio sp. KY-GH-1]
MRISKALTIFVAVCLSACGSDSQQRKPGSSSSRAASSAPPTSSEKELVIEFDQNNCLSNANSDAQTNFDFANQPFKLLRWNCVRTDKNSPFIENLSLLLPYDSTHACFSKVTHSFANFGGVFESERIPDCSSFAQPIDNPKMGAEIIAVNHSFKPAIKGAPNEYEFSYNFSWKNTGNVPIITYKNVFKLIHEQQLIFSTEEIENSTLSLPGQVITTSPVDLSSSDLVGGELLTITLEVTDFFGNVIAEYSQNMVVQ